jgi:cytidylate kinase
MQPLVVTLDGPAGSGKSSVARALAQRLGLEFLDTGAMYRGLAVLCLEARLTPQDVPGVVHLAQQMRMYFDWHADPPRLLVQARPDQPARDLTDRLRDPEVTALASPISAIAAVREVLVREQQRIGHEHPRLISEGRDQGSVVFPTATAKFYLDATPQVRAERRTRQLAAAGKPVDQAEVLRQITERDRRDSTRKDGPLVCPPDATVVDTSNMPLDQVINHLETLVRAKLPAQVPPVPRVPPTAVPSSSDARRVPSNVRSKRGQR